MAARMHEVAEGQRFRSVGAADMLWEVDAIMRYPLPHARLLRVGGVGEGKTIALNVLCDGRFYLPAG